MFDTVIVPLDGSRHAEAALPIAIDEARRHDANLVLLNVISRPGPCQSSARRSGPSPWQGERPQEEIVHANRMARVYLGRVAERFKLGPGTAQRVMVGDPGYRIELEARRYERPLIVLTTADNALADLQCSHVANYILAVGSSPFLGIRQPV
jgi:nucleotide-binding universal stress UspA family protein